jgi:sodium-dependent dicarboxylate transporter 2/3/5
VSPAEQATGSSVRFTLALLSGPLTFLLVYLLPLEGASYEGRVALATFGWAIAWWMTSPVPWAITAFMPILIFPIAGVLDPTDTMALYGQRIFFWLLGVTALGYAVEKHGLARRLALVFMSIGGAAESTNKLTFMLMVASALISMFVTDSAVIAMMIPIVISITASLRTMVPEKMGPESNLASFLAMGALYGAVAGGVGTMAGLPHNAVGVAMAERLGETSIGWFRWMAVGFPLMLAYLAVFYVMLRLLFPPEFKSIPGGQQYVRTELAALGPLSRAEKNVLVVFFAMVILFAVPPLLPAVMGDDSALANKVMDSFQPWIVPSAALFLLFVLPVNASRWEGTLEWNDVVRHVPWNVVFLCTGAVAITDAVAHFKMIELFGESLRALRGLGPLGIVVLAATATAITTNMFSGTATTALMCGIFIPLAIDVGYNPASIAILIPNVAVGIALPWAGASAGTVFASGFIPMQRMLKVGILGTALLIVVAVVIHYLIAPVL